MSKLPGRVPVNILFTTSLLSSTPQINSGSKAVFADIRQKPADTGVGCSFRNIVVNLDSFAKVSVPGGSIITADWEL